MAKINQIGNKTSALNINDEYDLPTVDGTINQILTTDGANTISWTRPSGIYVQGNSAATSSVITLSSGMSSGLPSKTSGDEVLTVSITPTNASNILYIQFVTWWASFPNYTPYVRMNTALFQDDDDDGFVGTRHKFYYLSTVAFSKVRASIVAGTTSATTIKARMGTDDTRTAYANGNTLGNSIFGGKSLTTLIVEEYKSL